MKNIEFDDAKHPIKTPDPEVIVIKSDSDDENAWEFSKKMKHSNQKNKGNFISNFDICLKTFFSIKFILITFFLKHFFKSIENINRCAN